MLGQSEPIDNLRLWLEDQDRRLLTVVCGRCNIIAIQFGRPKRCSSPRLCGYFADARVLVGARLLVDKDTAYVKSSSSRNIASLSCCIEVDAIHTLHGGQACDFPASARVHHDHAWGGVRTNQQSLRRFVQRRISGTLAADGPRSDDLATRCVNNLNFVAQGNKRKQFLS